MIHADQQSERVSSISDVSRLRHSGAGSTNRIVRSALRTFWELTSAMNVRMKQAQVTYARRAPAAAALLLALAGGAQAGPSEQAKRIYERIAGEPPSPAELTTMTNVINTACGSSGCAAGNAALASAAQTATSAPGF